jgi:hypothetical protein
MTMRAHEYFYVLATFGAVAMVTLAIFGGFG